MHSKIIEKIKMEEGDKARMYKCPAGKWTIGAGINLEAQDMPQEVRDLWLELILIDLREQLFTQAMRWYGVEFTSLDETVQLVLTDMAYQMGVTGLMGFHNMWHEIKNGDYELAADELLDSEYHRKLKSYVEDEETETRSERNAELLRGCA